MLRPTSHRALLTGQDADDDEITKSTLNPAPAF